MNTDKGAYTYDEIPLNDGTIINKILIRHSTDQDKTEDTFDTLKDVRKAVNGTLNELIFIQSEILNSLF